MRGVEAVVEMIMNLVMLCMRMRSGDSACGMHLYYRDLVRNGKAILDAGINVSAKRLSRAPCLFRSGWNFELRFVATFCLYEWLGDTR